jgi:hypoxanthine phosphoribosyltransferase
LHYLRKSFVILSRFSIFEAACFWRVKRSPVYLQCMVHLKDKVFDTYIAHSEILRRIEALAGEINAEYQDKQPLFVAVLNGSFMFAADLVRRITIPCEITFIRVASYESMASSGQVKKIMALHEDIRGRHVILLEDIVDTGITMEQVLEDIQRLEPRSVKVGTLLLKPDALQRSIPLHYVGFQIPNRFVVGYGLDYDGLGRNLPDLYVLSE